MNSMMRLFVVLMLSGVATRASAELLPASVSTQSLIQAPPMHSAALDDQLFPKNRPGDFENVLSLVYNGHRRAMIEPCGCVSYVLGGIDKEARLPARLAELRIPTVKVDAGGWAKEITLPGALIQTQFQVAALHEMQVDAVNVSFHDLGIGMKPLLDLQTSYALPLLSCNIVDAASGKLLFEPYQKKKVVLQSGQEIKVGIIGATRQRIRDAAVASKPGSRSTSGYVIRDAGESLNRHLPELRNVSDVVVLLYYGQQGETRELVQTLGDVRMFDIVVSGESKAETVSPVLHRDTWFVTGGFEGRQVGHMMLQFVESRLSAVAKTTVDVTQDLPPVPPLTGIIEEFRKRRSWQP